MYEASQCSSLGMRPSSKRHTTNKDHLNLLSHDEAQPLMLALDTEDDTKGRTYMVNFFDGFNHYTFDSTQAAEEWLLNLSRKIKKGVVVWTANVAYDVANLYRDEQSFLNFTLAGSRVITASVYKERIKFKDVLNIIPGASVKKLGKMIGLEKIEVDGDFNNKYYCQRDTEIVYWSVLSFTRVMASIGVRVRNTAASTAFNYMIEQYKELRFNNISHEEHEFMRQGYYGGRTEVFNTSVQKGKIQYFDIISSYPSVMRKIPLVNSFSRFKPKKLSLQYHGMSEVTIKAPDLDIPYLPYRTKDKLIFPIGTFRGVWTHFELNRAIELGYEVIKYHQGICFKRTYNHTLEDFVNSLFSERQKAKNTDNEVLTYAIKILLNSPYGRLGMGNETTSLVPLKKLKHIKGHFSSEIFPNDQVIVKQSGDYPITTNYFLASMITAMGRDNLYSKILEVQKNKDTPIYCDTDSLIWKGEELEENHDLGGFEKQPYEIKECQFILPKTYYLKLKKPYKGITEIYKCKGVRENLAKEYFTKGYAESLQPLKYVETCRKNFFISERNKKNNSNEPLLPFNLWIKKPKSQKAKYNKRKTNKNGATSPFALELTDDI